MFSTDQSGESLLEKPRVANDDVVGWFGLFVFCCYFFAFVFSNSLLLGAGELYWPRHVIVVGVALVSFTLFVDRAVSCVFLVAPLAIVYAIGGQQIYAAMVVAVGMSLPLFAAGIAYGLTRYGLVFPVGLLFLALVPAIMDIDGLLADGLFNTNYGRERMTLGYAHPKEAAAPFLVAGILSMLAVARGQSLLCILLVALLWLIGSRNSALTAVAFWYFISDFKGKYWIGSVLIGAGLAYLLSSTDVFGTLDSLSSLRLTVWTDALTEGASVGVIDLESNDRFGVDSFYVEMYLMAGNFGVAIFLVWLFVVTYFVLKVSNLPRLALAAAGSLLVFAAFDSGIASSGNLVHIFEWALVAIAFFWQGSLRKRRQGDHVFC